MRAKIQRSMLFIICVTLVATFVLLTTTYYMEHLNVLRNELKQDTFRAKEALEIWGYDFDGETRTVDVHVRTLRQKLGDAGELIRTVRGVGYMMGDSDES